MKDYSRSFYNGKKWKKLSSLYMTQRNYVCERCGGVAVICHHKQHISPANINDLSVTLNFDNLEALCQECHNREHLQKHSKAIFDSNGEMIGAKENPEIEEYKQAMEALQKIGLTIRDSH